MMNESDILGRFAGASYTVQPDDTMVRANEQARDLESLATQVEKLRIRMRCAYAGALFALTFLMNPWLRKFEVSFSATGEYDDQGGTYTSVSNSVSDVETVPGVDVPVEFLEADGSVNEDAVEEFLNQKFWDCETDLYGGFVDDINDMDDVRVTVDRDCIASILAPDGPSDGEMVFRRLFPQYAWRIRVGDAEQSGGEPSTIVGQLNHESTNIDSGSSISTPAP